MTDTKPLTPYNIIDFRAVLKHSFYSGKDQEAMVCPDTDRDVNHWHYGVVRFLERYADVIVGGMASPRQTLVAHDMGRDYRTMLFPSYKAARAKREKSALEDEQLDKMSKWMKEFFAAWGATQVGVKGVEADDVIAWLCQGIRYPKQVFTVDADLLQLVEEDCIVYLKMEPFVEGDSWHDIPVQLTSVAKSILGDTSDGYGGIKGMGPAKFQALLEAYEEDGIQQLEAAISSGSTKELDDAIEDSQDKNLIKLRENWSDWHLMYKLAQLHPELCWKPRRKQLTVPTFHKRVPNPSKVYDLLKQVGALDLWEQIEEQMPRVIAVDNTNWSDLRETVLEEILQSDVVAFDYETADKELNPNFLQASTSDSFVDMLSHQITGASFQFGKHLENVIYMACDHADTDNLDKSAILEVVEYSHENSRLVAQNFYFEGIITRTNFGVELDQVHDTQIMQRYVNENAEAGLKAMSSQLLGYSQASYEDTVGDKSNMSELSLKEVLSYGADDALVTGLIYDLLKLQMQVDGCWDFYCKNAVDATCVLQDSYVQGVEVDWDLQKKLHEDDLKTVETETARLRELLEANVTGEITAGCLSYIDSEARFRKRSAKRAAEEKEGLKGEERDAKVEEDFKTWSDRWKSSCGYEPYVVTESMPEFSPTPKQLSAAAVAVGLEEVSKTTNTFLMEYMEQYGMVGEDALVEGDAFLFLSVLGKAWSAGALKINDLRKKAEKSVGDEVLERKLHSAEECLAELAQVTQRLAGVEPRTTATGDELSLNSPVQMARLLYAKLDVPVRLHGKTNLTRMKLGIKEGSPSTDELAIQTALQLDTEEGTWKYEALNCLLKAKSAQTRIGLYHTKYPLWKHHKDGRMHPTFRVCGTDTRRPTGSAPNVLQVSKKFKAMRSQFVPPEQDYVVVAIDYASQEIRLMACEAKDPAMTEVYLPKDGGPEKDLHSMTGSGIAGVSYEVFVEALEDTSSKNHERYKFVRNKKGKPVNFGISYGAGPGTLARNLIVEIDESRELLNATFTLYGRIKPWQEETGAFMEKHGYTITAFGNKRHAVPDLFSKDNGKKARVHRQGVNATIQGAAADMLMFVLSRVWEEGLLKKLRMVFFAPVYDEVVAFVHKDDVLDYWHAMNRIMRAATPPGHIIPQIPELSIGSNWGAVREVGRDPSDKDVSEAVELALGD